MIPPVPISASVSCLAGEEDLSVLTNGDIGGRGGGGTEGRTQGIGKEKSFHQGSLCPHQVGEAFGDF